MLKVKAARYQKMFGKMRSAGDDMTAHFDPLNRDHMHMIETGDLTLVKEAPPEKTTRRKTARK